MVDTPITVLRAAAVACIAISCAACTGGVLGDASTGGTASAPPQYTLGGRVSGLSGSGLVLANNTGETLNVGDDESFTFKTTFPRGSPYYVVVLSQPSSPTQTCVATNSSGTMEASNVTSIMVACQDKTLPADTIGGVVVGLTGSGLVLQNNRTDSLAVAGNGTFVFPTALPGGSPYNISVLTPPVNPYEDCEVLNGKGTAADSDITSIGIVCTVNASTPHTIGGTISGVSGTLVLENNGRDALTLTSDGPFRFPLAIPSGSSYDVTTKSATGSQSQACSFTNAIGTVADSDINNVTIACQANVSLTASVSGLAGTGLVLQDTVNGEMLVVTANGTVAFPGDLTPGNQYDVIVAGQPTNPSQTCTIANASGTASAGAIVPVTCTTDTFTVGGIVTGLPDPAAGADLVLQDSLGGTFTIPATSDSPMSFTLPTPIASGATYSVTIKTQPGIDTSAGAGVTQTSTVCVVSAGAGTVTNTNVADVVVNCVRPLGFAYVTNSSDNTISTYIVDSDTGALLPSGAPVSTGTAPVSAAAVTMNASSLLYVSNSGSSNVSAYAIDANTGALTALAGSPFTMGGLNAPSSIAASGSRLYATNAGLASSGSISAGTIGTSGALTDVTGSPFAAQPGPRSGMYFSGGDYPTFNAYFLETELASDRVSAYLVDGTTGALSPVPNGPAPTGAAPTSVVGLQIFVQTAAANFDHVYVANSGDGTLSIYSMDTQTGNLTALPGGPLTIEPGLSAVTAAGLTHCCFVFASGPHGVWGFSTDQSGALTPLPNSPYAAGTRPGPIGVLADSYVYVVNTTDQTISPFQIGTSGAPLTPISGPAVKTGGAPASIVLVLRPNFG
jgi:Lactonase, 7-bladed beta-propeller